MTSITISRQFITRLMLESIPPVPFSHLMRPVDLWSQDHSTKLIIQRLTICILSPLLLTTHISPDMCDADFECWDSLLLYCWPSFSAFSLVSSLFHRFPFKLDFFLFLAVIFSVLTSHFIFL